MAPNGPRVFSKISYPQGIQAAAPSQASLIWHFTQRRRQNGRREGRDLGLPFRATPTREGTSCRADWIAATAAVGGRMVLADDIPAFQTEVFGGGQEMLIVRVNLAETVLLGTNEVEGIGGTEEDLFREVRELF